MKNPYDISRKWIEIEICVKLWSHTDVKAKKVAAVVTEVEGE